MDNSHIANFQKEVYLFSQEDQMKKITVLAGALSCLFLFSTAAPAAVTMDSAVKSALSQADGKVKEIELDSENNIAVYDITIIDSKGVQHEIKIDAVKGSVHKYQKDNVDNRITAMYSLTKIDYTDAIKTATENSKNSRVKKVDLSTDNGSPVYKIEFVDEQGIEYISRINATNGTLISLKQDTSVNGKPSVSVKDAEKAALNVVKGDVIYTELDKDDGMLLYKVKIISNDSKLYEAKVNATSGNVIKAEMD